MGGQNRISKRCSVLVTGTFRNREWRDDLLFPSCSFTAATYPAQIGDNVEPDMAMFASQVHPSLVTTD
jgi:hypothetical protein